MVVSAHQAIRDPVVGPSFFGAQITDFDGTACRSFRGTACSTDHGAYFAHNACFLVACAEARGKTLWCDTRRLVRVESVQQDGAAVNGLGEDLLRRSVSLGRCRDRMTSQGVDALFQLAVQSETFTLSNRRPVAVSNERIRDSSSDFVPGKGRRFEALIPQAPLSRGKLERLQLSFRLARQPSRQALHAQVLRQCDEFVIRFLGRLAKHASTGRGGSGTYG